MVIGLIFFGKKWSFWRLKRPVYRSNFNTANIGNIFLKYYACIVNFAANFNCAGQVNDELIKLFGLKRTRPIRYGRELDIFCPIEDFFELHSSATGGKKDKKWVKKGNFFSQLKKFK